MGRGEEVASPLGGRPVRPEDSKQMMAYPAGGQEVSAGMEQFLSLDSYGEEQAPPHGQVWSQAVMARTVPDKTVDERWSPPCP